jgi:hypothetical protein
MKCSVRQWSIVALTMDRTTAMLINGNASCAIVGPFWRDAITRRLIGRQGEALGWSLGDAHLDCLKEVDDLAQKIAYRVV